MSGEPFLPEIQPDGMRHWSVAGGAVRIDDHVLIVQNKRRNGETDWSTPGGVIDPGEAPMEALTREVQEETGLAVHQWGEPIYLVQVIAPTLGFKLDVVAFEAVSFSGEIRIADPDGIVIEAEFVEPSAAIERMHDAPRWVAEPFGAYLSQGVDDGRRFGYRVEGTSRRERTVIRVE